MLTPSNLRLAAYLSSATDREAAATKAAQEKLAALEAEIVKLGGGEDGGNKRKLDDHKFVEESREMVEGVKDAVKLAMLKKKKKAKLDNAAASSSTSTPVPAVEEKPVEEKLAEETPDASSSTGDAAPADAAVEPAAPVEVEAEAETEAGKEEKPKGKGKGRATRAKK
ncbi:hypothetical protein MNV49_003450 [Pseudohyphozyma bogoriensis]|nr:hypothetical protein MNV49_003450 [Pseudohyphozyma bogoriensis]